MFVVNREGALVSSRWEDVSTISDGMTADEKEENRVWCQYFIEKSH